MAGLTPKRQRILDSLSDKFARGDVLSDQEEEALSQAEAEGFIVERNLLERAIPMFKGERGLNQSNFLSSLGVEVGGAVGGLKAGAALPVPLPLRPITAIIGAGIGAMGGTAIAQKGIQGREELDLEEIAQSGALEVLIPGIGKVGQKVFKGGTDLFRRLFGASKEPTPFRSPLTEDIARETRKARVIVPLAAVFDKKLLSAMDSIASKSLSGGGIMSKQNQTVQEFLDGRITTFADKFVAEGSPLEIAKQLQKALNDDLTTFTSLRNKIIGRLDIAAVGREGAKVDLSGIGKGSVSFKEALDIIEEVSSPKITPKVKAAMLKSARKLDTVSTPVDGELAKLDFPENKFLTEELEKIRARETLQSSVDFVDDVKATFDLTDRMGKKFNQTIIKKLAKTKPEEVLDLLLSKGRPDTVRTLFRMKDIDGNPLLSDKVKDGLRAVFLGLKGEGGGLISRATEITGGIPRINGKKLLSDIEKFEGFIGKGASMALFEGTGLEGVKRYAKFLQVIQGRTGEGVGGIAIFLRTPEALQTLALFGAGAAISAGEGFDTQTILGIVGASVIIFGPLAIAKMLNNPKTFDNFAKGFQKRMKRPDDLTFYLTTIAAQMVKEGDDVRVIDTEETEELINLQRKQSLRETQQGLLEKIGNAPI